MPRATYLSDGQVLKWKMNASEFTVISSELAGWGAKARGSGAFDYRWCRLPHNISLNSDAGAAG